jgi:hypothetical protein
MESLTGGELNKLNGKYGISAPNKSVPVIKLIKSHKPQSKEELVRLIKEHFTDKCGCGIISQGTIEDFGKNLYETQIKEWKEYRYSLQDCIKWEYNLFVVQSLKGSIVEEKAKNIISKLLPNLQVEDANNYYDEELRIDLNIKLNNKIIVGLQIKPNSYKFVRQSVKFMNLNRNSLVNFKVFYLYYDYNTEEFLNIKEMIDEIVKIQS